MSAMIAPSPTKLITGEELLKMGDIGSCELIDGRIVAKEFANVGHGILEVNLGSELTVFVDHHKLGWVTGGRVGIYTKRYPDSVRGVDVAFISKARLPDGFTKGFLEVAPELVVEVMSPDDTWTEVRDKIAEYFAIGVLWVWVVVPKERAIIVHYPTGETKKFSKTDTLRGEAILEGFALPVAELFES